MDQNRRTTILALLTGALAGLAIVAARKGLPGAGRLAKSLSRPMQPKVETNMYGYRETPTA